MKKISNLEVYVYWFNRFSYFVIIEICLVSFLCYVYLYIFKRFNVVMK